MNDINQTLSRAIKEKKWLQITYKNKEEKITTYWIGIKDILENKRLLVDAVKYGQIDQDVKELHIFIESIQKASLIDSTYYPLSDQLINKIESSPMAFAWLNYFETDHHVLDYYRLCALEDSDLEERNFRLLEGFDQFQLKDNTYYLKNAEQIAAIYQVLSRQSKHAAEDRPLFSRLSMNVMSIKTAHSIRPILYRDVRLNLNDKTLFVSTTVRINPSIKNEHSTFYIKNLIGMEAKPFLELYQQNPKEALSLVEDNLDSFDRLDTNPYLAVFQKSSIISYEKEYEQITAQYYNNTLSKPMLSFFGKLGRINRRSKRDYPIFLTTSKINFDQLRGVFNAINQDITYIQGPPGTGKTHMIKEVAISSLFNDRKMLIVSNNNEAIDQVNARLNSFSYKNQPIPFLSLRLGNYDKTQETLDRLHHEVQKIIKNKKYLFNDLQLDSIKSKIIKSLSNTNDLIEAYESRLLIEENLKDLKEILLLSNEKLLPRNIKEDIKLLENELKKLPSVTENQLIEGIKVDESLLEQYLFHSSMKRLKMILRDSNKDLLTILQMTDSEKRVEAFNTYLSNNENLDKFVKIFPIIVTTNLSAARLGDASVHFDLMIMDEAGQCQVANSLIPMARCERALFVGDHRQLQPVIIIDPSKNTEYKESFQIPDMYDYADNSILKLMRRVDNKSLNIMLRRHYRSHHAIIEFSNQKYYGGKLIFDQSKQENAIEVIHVDNQKDNVANMARREISMILNLVRNKSKGEHKEIGVITPFRNQASEIQKQLDAIGCEDVKVGTVHTFQGGEKNHIIFSAALTQNTNPKAGEWAVNSEELINVAVTRAKNKFTMLADVPVIRSFSKEDKSDLYELYQYIQKKGAEKVSANTDILDNFVRSDDTYSEREFYETLAHFLTTQEGWRIGKKEKIRDVLGIEKKSPFYDYAMSAHFDFIIYVKDEPKMVFEIDGSEHDMVDRRKNSDMMKSSICKHFDIKLNRLPNHQTRRYDLVVDLINVRS